MQLLETFCTDRLMVNRIQTTDFADLQSLHQDPKVMATLSADGKIRSTEQTWQAINKAVSHWQENGFGGWMFRKKSNHQFVGYCGLKKIILNEREEVELLYSVRSQFWGQGFATEMAQAVVAIALNKLGIKNIIAYTLVINKASQRVMEKVGFIYEHDIIHVNLPHVLYRINTEL